MDAKQHGPVPPEQMDRLARQADAMGLSLSAYLLLLERAQQRQLDSRFRAGVKFLFKNYPETLKALSQ